MKFLIDGVDRLGKSTLSSTIMDQLGYHLLIHYDKPKVLGYYSVISPDNARKVYQLECNKNMFKLLETELPVIVDRTHLGEMVYAPLYRGYSGEYVYEMEQDLMDRKKFTHKDGIKLVLLTTSNFDIVTDDGQSFDFSKKEQEQEMFKAAFNRSAFSKVMVDVHNGKGGYKTPREVFEEVVKIRS